ncbi:unnamed protein product [Symbiodinium microadriaticum]|nr:unnamed protein product [Symbiodinium microadriaticum]
MAATARGYCEVKQEGVEREESSTQAGSPSSGSEVSMGPSCEDHDSLAIAALPGRNRAGSQRRTRRVEFDTNPCEVHEVIPYSEIYGIHPRDFVFDKYYSLVPAFQHFPVDVLAARALLERKQAEGLEVSEDLETETDSDLEPF